MKTHAFITAIATSAIVFGSCSAAKTTATADVADTPVAASPVQPNSGNNHHTANIDIDGYWSIINAGDVAIDRDEDMPYITFETSEGRFYANNGCNTLNGSFKYEKGKVEFFGVISTLRYCNDVDYELPINRVIADNRPWILTVEKQGTETFVQFVDENGKVIMKMRRCDMSFLNGNFKVDAINGIESVDMPADIFFDLDQLKVHGNTGCNYFNGVIYLDHRRANAVDFSNMALTRMACPNSAQETAIMVALEQTAAAAPNGHDKVVLLDADGKALMTLLRQ